MNKPLTLTYAWSQPYVQAESQSRVYLMIEISGTKSSGQADEGERTSITPSKALAQHVMLTFQVSDRANVTQIYGQPSYHHFGETTVLAGTLLENCAKALAVELELQPHELGDQLILLISGEYRDPETGMNVDFQQEISAVFTDDPGLLSLKDIDERFHVIAEQFNQDVRAYPLVYGS